MKTKKLSKLTIRRLRAIKKQILKEPRQFQMAWLFARKLKVLNNFGDGVAHLRCAVPNCGTAACIAGWACTLFLKKKLNPAKAESILDTQDTEAWSEAQRLLGLDDGEIDDSMCECLFMFENWPIQFKEHKKEGTPTFARQAAARIEYFIKTNGTDKE